MVSAIGSWVMEKPGKKYAASGPRRSVTAGSGTGTSRAWARKIVENARHTSRRPTKEYMSLYWSVVPNTLRLVEPTITTWCDATVCEKDQDFWWLWLTTPRADRSVRTMNEPRLRSLPRACSSAWVASKPWEWRAAAGTRASETPSPSAR